MRKTCYRPGADGLLVHFRLTPNASKDEVLGLIEGGNGPLVSAKVRAIADKGKANKALIALAGKWLDVAKTDITLKSGSKSRLKTLLVKGDTTQLSGTLEQALGALEQ